MPYLIDNHDTHDPRLNLALEEHCLRSPAHSRDYLLLYINEPAVIVGRHQNVLEEIDHRYVSDKGIHVVRRISGGGAVYHDFGNLNFSFIGPYNRFSLKNIGRCLAPLLGALHKMGVRAELNAMNDIVINDRKISGNAQFSNTHRIVVHGTLLFDTDLEALHQVLKSTSDHITSRARKSIRSPVANISDYLTRPVDMAGFRQRLLAAVASAAGPVEKRTLSDRDWDAVYRLAEDKYNRWQWNWGKSPSFQVRKAGRFGSRRLSTRIDVTKGRIAAINMDTDIAANGILEKLQGRLIGLRYDFKEIQDIVNGLSFKGMAEFIPAAQMVNLLY